MNIAAETIPTLEQINQTKSAIDAHIQTLNQHPDRREGALPYYLFHEPGRPIRGTVMIFHGFSAKPHQMWRLADYLFQNGFNVYQPSIAGHSLVNPAKNWCQVDLKPEYAEPMKTKVQKDPVLQTFIQNFMSNLGAARPGFMQQMGLMARLLLIEPQLLDIAKSIELSDDPDFDQYYTSSHLSYLIEAQERLKELDAMPGNVFTVGLSVGGAVALGLAAARPDRIRGVVAYAPLLKIYGEERRRYVNLAGPLDITESGWDANLRFPIGCLTAADRFGSSVVMSEASVRSLSNVPTFLVLTENEDAADIETSQNFYQQIGGESEGHRFFLYPKEALVPHPMVDPSEVSQNMSNRFWQSLYQESFRFLSAGRVNTSNLSNIEQDPNLPIVTSV